MGFMPEFGMIYLWTFLIAFISAFFLSPAGIKIGEWFCAFSKPKRGELKDKPCFGGIGIYIAFVTASVSVWFLHPAYYNSRFTVLISASSLIALSGLVDDVKELKPFQKIAAQLVATGVLVLFGVVTKISFLPIWTNILLTFIWVLFITNGFNLLDIVDGLASGLAIIISLTLLVVSLVNKDIFSSIILISLIGAHSGFLRYNYPPAKFYMGDTGSLFSGFLLAAISINTSYTLLGRQIALITPLVAMSLPIYGTLFLIIMRIVKQRPIFTKTNDSIVLRLVTMGYSVRKSIWIMYLFSIFLAISSLIIAFGSNMIGILALIIVISVFIFTGKRIGMVMVKERG